MLAKLDEITLNYECVGTGRPMLMLHGGYLDHRHMMDEMEPAFVGHNNWMRVYPDLPDHGETGSSEAVKNFDDILRVVLQLADSVFPGERFAVSGMSAGGHLARGLVQKRRQQMIGVMMNATAFVTDPAERTLPEPGVIFEDDGFEEMAGAGLNMLRYVQPVRNAQVAEWYHRSFAPARALLSEASALASWEPQNYAFSFDLDLASEPFEGPSLIVCGRQDTVVGFRDAWPVNKDYPRATFAVLDWGGHMIEPACKDLFKALVVDWLKRMELAEKTRQKQDAVAD